jgi:hypothetical protein
MLDLQTPTEIAADLRLDDNPLLRSALRAAGDTELKRVPLCMAHVREHLELAVEAIVESGLGERTSDGAKLNEKGKAVLAEIDRMDAEDLAAELARDWGDEDDD